MNNYVSSGQKILRHLDVLKKFRESGRITPISLQIAPTSRCNLNCVFCSNVNRKKHQDLDFLRLHRFLYEMRRSGAKTVEWTGGGDPTQYSLIKGVISYSHDVGLKQGFITNGIDLVRKIGSYMEYLDWIRISLNSLDYVSDVEIPIDYKGVLGFSYVVNEKTTNRTWSRLKEYAQKYNPKYVRIVPNCQITETELKYTNIRLSRMVDNYGPPFFYQKKEFSQPERCWWGYFKPFILHDGYVYRCSSVVLNNTANRSFHKKFRWMTMEDFINAGKRKAIPFNCEDCTNCVFRQQNDLVETVINPEMECFV
jgi:MoaA/NifB/PqqE/SkfB family radical SAM enzyme